MDRFNHLHPIIKFTTAIPIIILILAVFIQTSRKDRGASNTQSVFIPNTSESQYDSSGSPEAVTNSFFGGKNEGFNLEKSQMCTYTGDDIDVEVQIKDKQIFAQVNQNNQESYVLLKQDCIYQWLDEESKGTKICNIGQYVSMFEMFSSLLSPSSMLSSIPGLDSTLPISTDALSGIYDSCKESDVDEALFEIPPSISFQEKSITDLQQQEE